MKDLVNPFSLDAYISKELFCDRKKEVEDLYQACMNGRNVTLISHRRMGKTGLIYRFFDEIAERHRPNKFITLYADSYATQNIKEFTQVLAEAIFKQLSGKTTIAKRLRRLLTSLQAVVSYNTLTGEPNISISLKDNISFDYSLKQLFTFLEAQQVPVIFAIDEFQQVAAYPEKNAEALLRSIIQHLTNVHFIFSGSNRGMMTEIFAGASRPFFASTQFISLEPIPRAIYKNFIIEKFANNKRIIEEEAVDFILDWTYAHTYYTQALCNHIYAKNEKHINLPFAKQCCHALLELQAGSFIQYRNLLTPAQWSLLRAIAKEGEATNLTGAAFAQKYGITASSVQRILPVMVEKQMVMELTDREKTHYRLYDCFFGKWLASL